jgi:outer membrane protein assembly factor BamD
MTIARMAGILALGLLAGCSAFGDDEEEVALEQRPASEIYAQGEALLADDQPAQAARVFDEIERLYPFSQFAKRALVMSAFASYEAGQYAAARAAAQRYVDLYPADKDAAYAQYLIALTHYDNITDVGRDQGKTEAALDALQVVTQRYPESDYARDAALKIDLARDHLAGKEMSVGRYYLKRGHYVAAINRFTRVVEEYETTSQTPEALHRLVEANLAMGLEREALAAAAVLGENFPGSEWYARSYELLTGREVIPDEEDGFLSRVYRQVIQGKWL